VWKLLNNYTSENYTLKYTYMKKLFILILSSLPMAGTAQNLRCMVVKSYAKITNGGPLTKVSSPATVCFNDYYFSFYTPQTGTRTFRIDANTLDSSKGFVHQRFISAESNTNSRGDYNVQVDYEKEKTVSVTFTRFGEVYIFEATKFVGSMDNPPIGRGTWKSETAKVTAVSVPVPAAPVSKWQDNYNTFDAAKLGRMIGEKITEQSQFVCTFLVRIDEAGRIKEISPERPMPERFEKEIGWVRTAAAQITVPPVIKAGAPVESYTHVKIDLHNN
jgi:hypothetical protein